MDFQFTREQEEFRKEIQDFLEEEIKKGTFVPKPDVWIAGYSPEFSHKLAERGWIGVNWPKEYGGGGRGVIDRLILTEELLRYGAPCGCHWFSDRQIGPSLLRYGNEEIKQEFLPKIAKAEVFFGIGMSEPEAGSDLASIKTKAREDGDYYVIDGQKVWTSGAQYSTHVYIVAVTDPDAKKKYQGISEFIVDLSLPGITVRPLTELTGEQGFNEVFFDGVRVHKKYLLGEKNKGWYQVLPQLDFERSGIERLMSNYVVFDELVKYVKETKRNGKPLGEDPAIRSKLAEIRVRIDVGRLLVYRIAWFMSQAIIPNYETAMTKAFCTAVEQDLVNIAMEILGPYGQLMPESKWTPIRGTAVLSYLFSPGYTMQGGTTEILKGIVAGRGLGLR
jgi:alkylation response protein AidB-like acyl-CoA dehydrogenase